MEFSTLITILVAAAAAGVKAFLDVIAALKVDFGAMTEKEKDDAALHPEIAAAVASIVRDDPGVTKALKDRQIAAEKFAKAQAKFLDAVDGCHPLASRCVAIDADGAIVTKPGATRNVVTRTRGTKTTVGQSVVGAGSGNGSNTWAMAHKYIGMASRAKVRGTSFVLRDDGKAWIVIDGETAEVAIPYASDGSLNLASIPNAIIRYRLVQDDLTAYFDGLALPAKRAKGQTLADYIVYLMSYSHKGINARREYGGGDIVIEG